MPSETQWKVYAYQECNVGKSSFIEIINLWIHSPEYVSKKLRRAEIKSDLQSDGKRTVHRALIPRKTKGNFIIDQMIYITENSNEVRVEFYPFLNGFIQDASLLPTYFLKLQGYAYIFKKETECKCSQVGIEYISFKQDAEALLSERIVRL